MNKKIYAIGGGSYGKLFDSVESFDPKTQQWTGLCPLKERRWARPHHATYVRWSACRLRGREAAQMHELLNRKCWTAWVELHHTHADTWCCCCRVTLQAAFRTNRWFMITWKTLELVGQRGALVSSSSAVASVQTGDWTRRCEASAQILSSSGCLGFVFFVREASPHPAQSESVVFTVSSVTLFTHSFTLRLLSF